MLLATPSRGSRRREDVVGAGSASNRGRVELRRASRCRGITVRPGVACGRLAAASSGGRRALARGSGAGAAGPGRGCKGRAVPPGALGAGG
eukprot:14635176-Heterocapsa_arctica.AAC.1